MELPEAMNLLRQACEQHQTSWAQHQLMQQALIVVQSALDQPAVNGAGRLAQPA